MQIELGVVVAIATTKDTKVSIFTPPYADQWTHSEGRHQQMIASADKGSGFLRVVYTIGKEGGSTYLGAGVAVLFMREVAGHPPGHGPAGVAQIRTDTPYLNRWRDVSYLGTARQHGGFGVLVGSWSTSGGPGRIDQDHQRWTWSDGTDWYKTHSNPNWSGFNAESALRFGDQAPYFTIEPGRMYVGWVWCFVEADAHAWGLQVQAEQAGGETGQRRTGQRRGHDGHQQRRADRDLAGREEAQELPGLDTPKQRVGPAGESV